MMSSASTTFEKPTDEELPPLRGYHVWSEAVVEERFHRWQKSLHVLLVRVYALPRPATVPVHEEHAGCKSWVELVEDVSIEGAQPVQSDEEYQCRANEICSNLRADR